MLQRGRNGVAMPALGTKLRVPPPRRTLVQRARLANPFVAGAPSTPRLLLISASAGFGKTTLLTQWLTEVSLEQGSSEGEPRLRVAWVSLDEADADRARFLASLVASLARPGDDVGREAQELLDGDRVTAVDEVLASIISDLDEVAGPTVIALDDYHRADGPDINEAMTFLLENLPPQVTIALTTRSDPLLPLARLRTRGELHEVRDADLRFTHEESDTFLRTVMDLELDPAHVRALEARTEGWVAGLQLAALSAKSRATSGSAEALEEFVDEFSGSHRFVLDYLVEEVLDTLSEDVRAFLLLTSVLENMTGPLCDAVTGLDGGQVRLEGLDRGNVFVVPLDDRRQWYRYHQLFADALRARLLAERPDVADGLHAAASRWFASEGMLEDAFWHARRSRDVDWAAEVVELAIPELRRRRGDRTLIEWLDALPDPVITRRPLLAAARAFSRLSRGDTADAASWLDTAEHALGGGPPGDEHLPGVPDELLAGREDERRTVPATIAIYRAALAQATGDSAGTVRHALRARAAAAPTDHLAQGAAAGFIALASWADGDLASADRTFRGAVAHLRDAGNITDQLGATVVLADLALALGSPNEARHLYEDALTAAEDNPAPAAGILGDLHVGLADTRRENGDLDSAIEHLQVARELGDSASLLETRFRWHTTHAGVLVGLGDVDGAIAELQRAEEMYLPGFFPNTRPIAASRARVLITAGRLAEAREWADERSRSADATNYLDEYEVLTHARLAIAEHRGGTSGLDMAVAVLDRVVDAAEHAGRPGSFIEARMVRALASQAQGNTLLAHRDLAVALTEAVPAGYRRLFLDEGAPMQDLLQDYVAAAEASQAASLARQVLAIAQRPRTHRPAAPFGVEDLSERELEVMRLLGTDLTGPQIAAHLFVSINTLRTHTKHIFTKLDVKTRRAAVTRATQLNLL